MNKLPYNCYIDHKGYIMPKSAIIKLTPEIVEWLSNDNTVRFLFIDKPNSKVMNKEWLSICIGHSYVGNIYAYAADESKEVIDKYFIDNPYVKIFDENDEAFMKYMKWIAKLGTWFTKQRFKKKIN